MISNLRLPYVDNSLNGIITHIKNNYSNFFSKIKATIAPDYGHPAKRCIDRDSQSFCHSHNSSKAYLEVYFPKYKVILDGYSIQNRIGYYWDILNWKMMGSNDGINYYDIDTQNFLESSEYCGNNMIRSFPVFTYTGYSYLRLQQTGGSCGTKSSGDFYFNLAEIEFFGTIISDNFYYKLCTRGNFYAKPFVCIILSFSIIS